MAKGHATRPSDAGRQGQAECQYQSQHQAQHRMWLHKGNAETAVEFSATTIKVYKYCPTLSFPCLIHVCILYIHMYISIWQPLWQELVL